MSYFSKYYSRINFPIANDKNKGLRNAQLGAIYAIGSHFTLNSTTPALIVMPTGSGKTAVLNLSAYLLRANRVLVISSSVMVRGQIVEEFSSLVTLKASNVFHSRLKTPKVIEIKSPIKSIEEWNKLKKFDVVVGIPNSINVGINNDFKPPIDLFDLILIDEAHHVPAFTWTNIVKSFGTAKKIYFTATPFRRDKKEIKGKLAYIYPLSKAYEDKIFGDIGYYPVITNDINKDIAIAKKTEEVFNNDTEAGFNHAIMVRTERKDHANILLKLYEENTELKLKKVDSTLSYRTIKSTIKKLKAGELNGIICVDMLGEGFDFPNLKICALHSPKKSIANTLQFIGRFARTNAENIGEAKFLAIPSDIEIGKKKLYEEGAIWNDIIKNLSDEIIEEEDEIKEILDTFEKEETDSFLKEDISFYNLNPYCHVKVYKAEGIDLDGIVEIAGHKTIYHAISKDYNSIVFITKESERPKWILTNDLLNIRHFFFLVYYDLETKLLFINSSIKTYKIYDDLVKSFAVGKSNRISKFQLNKVLVDIDNPEFFNIGMQNRSANSGESYRIIAGPNAENTIRKSHSKNYANGHVFMKGVFKGENVTVGYSSGSKVWSNAYEKIPNFIKWCKALATKIESNEVVKTNTGFDNLPIGKTVDNFQLPAQSAMWHHDTFHETPRLIELKDDEIISNTQLLDFGIELVKDESSLNQLVINLIHNDHTIQLTYDFDNHYQFKVNPEHNYILEINGHNEDLIDYLNEAPLQIYLDDFANIINHEYFGPPNSKDYQYSSDKILSFDWKGSNTDITKEFYESAQSKIDNGNKNSIHETLQTKLLGEGYDFLIYDHGTGEVADFITLNESENKIEINLYHVKGSTGDKPGNRVADVYEVCMQVVKSQVWTTNKHSFKNKIIDRTKDHLEKFILGDQKTFTELMTKSKIPEYSFTLVQPGISKDTFTPKLSFNLAATDDSLINNGNEPLIVLGS